MCCYYYYIVIIVVIILFIIIIVITTYAIYKHLLPHQVGGTIFCVACGLYMLYFISVLERPQSVRHCAGAGHSI